MTDTTEAEPTAEAPQTAAPLEERLAAAEAEIARLKDEHLRALAEVENVRRRGEKQAQDARVFAIDRFARDLLGVADTLSRALAAAPADVDGSAAVLVEGVAMTEKQMLDVFARHGLRRVGERGEKFDPNLHQAVAQIPSDAPAGAVAEVFQPGYMLAERTLRAAMVAVSLGAGQPAEPAKKPSEPPGSTVDVQA